MVGLAAGRERPEVADHLCDLAQADPHLAVGLDFSFSLPAWWMAEHGLSSAPELWAAAATQGETWLAACAPPWWGRPGRPRPPASAQHPQWRRTELTLPAVAGIRPKPSFQIGGAGTVGTGSVRGMPVLARLREAGFAIWPFDPPALPVVVEIWPRLLTGPVGKSDPQARRRHLDRAFPDLAEPWAATAASNQDAFDATCSALVMAAQADALASLDPFPDAVDRVEGRIWEPGGADGTVRP